jgi:hypothetical protein
MIDLPLRELYLVLYKTGTPIAKPTYSTTLESAGLPSDL